jgi:hypothetical protein
MKKLFLAVLTVLAFTVTNAQNNCSDIEKSVSEFTGKISYRIDISENPIMVSINRSIRKHRDYIFLMIYIPEGGIYTGNGVYMILKDGQIISRPEEEVGYSLIGSQFYTSELITLTEEDIEKMTVSGLKKFKLYLSTGELTDKQSDKFSEYLKCIVNF